MRLVTYEGGFGRIEGDNVVPMGSDIIEFLATGDARRWRPESSWIGYASGLRSPDRTRSSPSG